MLLMKTQTRILVMTDAGRLKDGDGQDIRTEYDGGTQRRQGLFPVIKLFITKF